MGNEYRDVGIAAGFREGLSDYRDRKLEDQDRTVAAEERTRRHSREDQAGLRETERFEREQKGWKNRDIDREMDIGDRLQEDTEHIQDRARSLRKEKTGELEHEQDRAHTIESRDLGLSQAKKQAKRQDYAWSKSLEETSKAMREEGMHDAITALEKGVAPAMIESEFNARGELKIVPGSLRYDPATRIVSFSGPDGGKFDGPIDQLKAIFSPQATPIKLGANDRLIDPTTKKVIVPPAGGGAGGAGGAGSADFAKWNRQTASDKAADVVREGLGLKYDSELQSWSIPEGMSEKVGYGAALAGQITREFGSRISAEEAGDIALRVMKTVPTIKDARAQAQQRGKTTEQDIAAEVDVIMRAARVKAAQQLAMLTQDKESELEQKEAAMDGGGEPGLSAVGAGPQPSQSAQPAAQTPPANALKEGVVTKFRNGQSWTLQGGNPVQVQ